MMRRPADIDSLKNVLKDLKSEGKVLLAYLFGSYAKGRAHSKSDIDLAVYLNALSRKDEVSVIDRILMASERQVGLLRLDDTDESPFMVQEALKGIPLISPDRNTLYEVSRRALHESESIRYQRAASR